MCILGKLNAYNSIAELLSGLVEVRSGSISSFWPRTIHFRHPMSGHFQIPPAYPKTFTLLDIPIDSTPLGSLRKIDVSRLESRDERALNARGAGVLWLETPY